MKRKYSSVLDNVINYNYIQTICYPELSHSKMSLKLAESVEHPSMDAFADVFIENVPKSEIVYTTKYGWVYFDPYKHRWIVPLNYKGKIYHDTIEKYIVPCYRKAILFLEDYDEPDDDNKIVLTQFIKSIENMVDSIERRKYNLEKVVSKISKHYLDDSFVDKLDQNNNLLAFKNGVIDFKERIFRDGCREDMISRCMGVSYVDYNSGEYTMEDKQIIDQYMDSLFPAETKEKIFQYIETIMQGNGQQRTDVWVGNTYNGKSYFIGLLQRIMGTYGTLISITEIPYIHPIEKNKHRWYLRGCRLVTMDHCKIGRAHV